MLSRSGVSDSLRPPGLQPTRLLCPWDPPGKNTGVGCCVPDPGIEPASPALQMVSLPTALGLHREDTAVSSLSQRSPANLTSSFCDFNMNLIKHRLSTSGSGSRQTLIKLDSAHKRRSSQCILQGPRRGLGSLTAAEGQVHRSSVTPGGRERWRGKAAQSAH